MLENVKNLASHDGGKTQFQTILETLRDELGYHVDYHLLNALDFGLPQKRERIIIVGSKKPFKMDWNFEIKNRKTLKDILEKNVDPKHFASPAIVAEKEKRCIQQKISHRYGMKINLEIFLHIRIVVHYVQVLAIIIYW